MIKIFLTSDPETGRALYDDESRFMGLFTSLAAAENELGELLHFCSIRPDSHKSADI